MKEVYETDEAGRSLNTGGHISWFTDPPNQSCAAPPPQKTLL